MGESERVGERYMEGDTEEKMGGKMIENGRKRDGERGKKM